MEANNIIRCLGQQKIATALGITRYAVYHWTRKRVPAERCQQLVDYAKSQGMDIKPSDLRPDIFE